MKLILPLLLVLSLAFEGYEGYNTILDKLTARRMLEELREDEKVEDGGNPELLEGLAKRINNLAHHFPISKKAFPKLPEGYTWHKETLKDGGTIFRMVKSGLDSLPKFGSSDCVNMLATPLMDSQITTILKLHNDARYETGNGMAPLTWDVNLAADAQAWANTCQWRHDQITMCHPGYSKGQNMAKLSSNPENGHQAVTLWVDEQDDYNYERNSCAAKKICGHYTQVVWAYTESVGCGITDCSTSTIVVCNYHPAGNTNGKPPYK